MLWKSKWSGLMFGIPYVVVRLRILMNELTDTDTLFNALWSEHIMIQTPSLSLRYEHIDLKRHALKGTVAQDFRFFILKKPLFGPHRKWRKKGFTTFFLLSLRYSWKTTKKRGHDKETWTSTANVEGFSQIVREQSGKKVLECNNLEIWILLT